MLLIAGIHIVAYIFGPEPVVSNEVFRRQAAGNIGFNVFIFGGFGILSFWLTPEISRLLLIGYKTQNKPVDSTPGS